MPVLFALPHSLTWEGKGADDCVLWSCSFILPRVKQRFIENPSVEGWNGLQPIIAETLTWRIPEKLRGRDVPHKRYAGYA